ncbi:response regulator [Candidatus Dependentiae bacterium]|nr:response regulator [Candidatus Dependentiae bacterium]
MKTAVKLFILAVFILTVIVIFFLIKKNSNIILNDIKNNISYQIGKGSILSDVDETIEAVKSNVEILGQLALMNFDLSSSSKKYFSSYINKIDSVTKLFLINTKWAHGVWVQLNPDLTFKNSTYCSWFLYKNGHPAKQVIENREFTPSEDPYYFKPITAGKGVWSEVYTDFDIKETMISYSIPLYKNSKLIGVAGIDITLKELSEKLIAMRNKYNGAELFLTDIDMHVIAPKYSTEGKEICNKDLCNCEKNLSFIKKKFSAEPSGYFDYVENGKNKIAVFTKVSDNFNIIATIPVSSAYRTFNILLYSLYVILAILMITIIYALRKSVQTMKNNKILENQTSILHGIIKSSNDVIYYKDIEGKYIGCNNVFELITGKDKNEIIGKTDFELFSESFSEENKIIENRILETGGIHNEDRWFTPKNRNPVYYNFQIVPLKNNSGELIGLLGIGRDMTKNKLAEQEIIKAKERAEELNKLKNEFLTNVSHEIRTPMNAIIGFSDFLLKEKLTSRQTEFIKIICENAEKLLDLINDILDISWIESNKFKIAHKPFNISLLIKEVLSKIKHKIKLEEKPIEVVLNMENIYSDVVGDHDRLKRILINLLSNAEKFTDKGTITFSVKTINENDEFVTFEILVQDTGIGISEKIINTIFEPFKQADSSATRKYGGTGLGLTVTKKMIDLMNGSIRVESELGIGSKFYVIIKLKKGYNQSDKNNIQPLILKKYEPRILAVDDNDMNLKLIEIMLEKMGYKNIDFALDGEEAVKMAENNKYDLILMDIQMPVMNGIEAFKMIKNKKISVPVIALTADAMEGSENKYLNEGMDDYISKPIDKYKFQAIIQKWLGYKQEAEISDYEKNVEDNANKDLKNCVEENESNNMIPDGKDEMIVQRWIKYMGEDKDFQQLTLNGIKMIPSIINRIENYINSNNIDELKKIVHSQKGSLGSIGIINISNILSEMSAELKKNDFKMENIKRLFAGLIEIYNKIPEQYFK